MLWYSAWSDSAYRSACQQILNLHKGRRYLDIRMNVTNSLEKNELFDRLDDVLGAKRRLVALASCENIFI